MVRASEGSSLLLPLGLATSPSMQHANDGRTASLTVPISGHSAAQTSICLALGSDLTQLLKM